MYVHTGLKNLAQILSDGLTQTSIPCQASQIIGTVVNTLLTPITVEIRVHTPVNK